MKLLLRTSGLIEAITGLGLAIVPSFLVSILLGTSISDPVAVLLGRLAGSTLFIIALACLFANGDSQSDLMIKAMLVYNIISVLLLAYAALVEGIAGPGLWPAVFIHAVLLAWCVVYLSRNLIKR